MSKEKQMSESENAIKSKLSSELHFLIDQHFKEVAHFWTRTNVFLVTNVAAFGGALSLLNPDNMKNKWTLMSVSIAGMIFCFIWYFINSITKYYEKRWLYDAKRLAESNDTLKLTYFISLGFRENKKHTKKRKCWFDDEDLDLRRPNFLSATDLMYCIISLLFAGWMALFLKISQQL